MKTSKETNPAQTKQARTKPAQKKASKKVSQKLIDKEKREFQHLKKESERSLSQAKDKPSFKDFSLSKERQEIIRKEMTRYETKLSCLIPCLWEIQKEKGWISKQAVTWLSDFTQIPESQIYEVLMFYTMFNKKPVGKFHIQVCANVSCALKGGRELVKDLCEDFNVKEGERSACGNWTISKVECLGACDEAPVIQLNNDYIGNIKKEDFKLLLKSKI